MRRHAIPATALCSATLVAVVIGSCAPDPPHDKGERFPLEGKHAALPCEACHGTDGFEALPTACASCHEKDRPPDHYPGDCGECHTAFGWLNFGTGTGGTTTTDPHQSTFPLQDAHDLPCNTCHGDNGFEGLDPACESCHQQDEPPYHFPGSCQPCHPTTAWTDGSEHLPLPHHNAECLSCHASFFDLKTYSCTTGCHAQADTDPLHAVVGSYVYDSVQCVACHFP